MSLEDRLNSAKKENQLTKTPTLRRVILRSRWYATIGGVFMLFTAVREWSQSALEDSLPVGKGVSFAGVLFSIAVLVFSRKISRAADEQNHAALPRFLKGLQITCISGLLLLFASETLVFLMNDSRGDSLQPLLLLPTLPVFVIFGVWIRDILKAGEEVKALARSSDP